MMRKMQSEDDEDCLRSWAHAEQCSPKQINE